ncbi:MAG TPA: hypothetical protein VFF67_00715 [Thermoplasmata archaeon]|nr:hypothetical protein [Thermoplasmata archaeon]
MAPLFGRFRKGKAAPEPEEPVDEMAAESPPTGAVEGDPPAAPEPPSPPAAPFAAPAPAPAPPKSAPVGMAIEPGPPPPLPQADAAAIPPSIRSQGPLQQCFLCGAEMQGAFCPTCRMIWRE